MRCYLLPVVAGNRDGSQKGVGLIIAGRGNCVNAILGNRYFANTVFTEGSGDFRVSVAFPGEKSRRNREGRGYFEIEKGKQTSGKRGSNSRPLPWQGSALPLSYSRRWRCVTNRMGKRGFEPLHLSVLVPKTSVSAVPPLARNGFRSALRDVRLLYDKPATLSRGNSKEKANDIKQGRACL